MSKVVVISCLQGPVIFCLFSIASPTDTTPSPDLAIRPLFFRFYVHLVVDEGTGLKFLDAGQSGNERAVLSLSLSGCLMAKGPATRGPGRWQNRPKLRRKTSRSSVISLVPSQGSDCQAGRCRHLRLQCGSGGVPVTAMPT